MNICRGPECGRPVVYQKDGVCRSHKAMLNRTGELKPLRRQKNSVDDGELVEQKEEAIRNKGGRPSKVSGKCSLDFCDRDAQLASPMMLCKAHWMQQHMGRPYSPLRQYMPPQDSSEETRVCSVCRRTKNTQRDFHLRSKGAVASECKFCAGKRSRITQLFREDRVAEAEALIGAWEAYVGENRNGWEYSYQPIKREGLER